jgi:hypothetical protein
MASTQVSTKAAGAPGGEHGIFTTGRRWRLLMGAVALGLLAMTVRFFGVYRLRDSLGTSWAVADDVYISADFARTFAEGHGLLWYEGAPKVEGFTNPSWVALLSLIHLTPAFEEDRLGLYVAAVNGLLMIAIAMVLVGCVARATSAPSLSAARSFAIVVSVCTCCTILCFCAGVGFETALVALLSMLAFYESLAPAESLRLHRIALVIGLAFWTRMDGVVTCAGAVVLVLIKCRSPRRLGWPAASLTCLIASQFILRRWYYSDWLPNTVYLKATGWALRDRLVQGVIWNAIPLSCLALTAVPGWFLLRRKLGSAALPAAVALTTYLSTLLYSMNNGGDLIYAFGQDRFSAVGSVFLAFAVSCGAVVFQGGLGARAVALTLSLALTTGPMWLPSPRESLEALVRFLDLRKHPVPQDGLVKAWIHQGKLLREFTSPAARVALCGAGALVYFSHRGGVDILGKIEPLVAHLQVPKQAPPEARCWRGFPGAGHNKEDLRAVFRARRPELSVIQPPDALRRRYVRVTYSDTTFFALKANRYINWKKVKVLPDG